jgi:long-subunit acyl-CoA synthetase (AMP-forming)
VTVGAEEHVLHGFYRVVRSRPGDVYLTQPLGGGRVEEFSFARCLDEARRMASHLRSLGFPPQSRIAIVSKNCAHFFLCDLAIWMAGHVSVALFPTYQTETVRYVLTHSDARLLFVGKVDAWEEIARGIPAGMPSVAFPLAPPVDLPRWDDLVARHPPIEGEPRRQPGDWATIIYTSGSTGQPKGVVHTFASLSAAAYGVDRFLGGIRSGDRALSYLPLAHAMDRWISECASMVTGYQVYFADSMETFLDDLRRARPTLFISVPRLWLKFQRGVLARVPERRLARLLRIPVLSGLLKQKVLASLGLDQVRFAASGSAPIPPELITWYRDLGLELLEGYGMTENMGYSHATRPGRGVPGSVGQPLEGVTCRLGEGGEILVKSPATMVGYFKEPELTREAFTEDGFLKTGDLGVIEPDGRLIITGRVKELFKTSKGKYVAPAPIENLLNRSPYVELSCVAGASQSATHAVVQLAEHVHVRIGEATVREEVTAALARLLEAVNRELPSYERLAFIAVARERWSTEDGSLTPSLKLKRTTIEARYARWLPTWYAARQPVLWEA